MSASTICPITLTSSSDSDDATILPGATTRVRIGDRFGDWKVEAFLGAGSFGTVWRARRNRLGGEQIVALKILDRLLVADAREQLVREFTLLSSLEHPNMLRYLDAFEVEEGKHAGFVVFVLELADTDLCNAIALSVNGLGEQEMCSVFAELAEGIGAFHREGQAHGDIKPANILRVGSVWKLADFGIAAPLDGSYSLVGGTTLDYCPPEELTGAIDAPSGSSLETGSRRLHRSADVWALGIALFEAVTKRHPYVGDSPRTRLASIMSDRRDFTGVSPQLAVLLDQRCLAVDHHARIDPFDLAVELRKIANTPVTEPLLPVVHDVVVPSTDQDATEPLPILDTLPIELPKSAPAPTAAVLPSPAVPSSAKPSKRRMVAAIGGLLVIVAAVLGYLVTRPGTDPSPVTDPSIVTTPAVDSNPETSGTVTTKPVSSSTENLTQLDPI
jgi:serine/threonine protein kinase